MWFTFPCEASKCPQSTDVYLIEQGCLAHNDPWHLRHSLILPDLTPWQSPHSPCPKLSEALSLLAQLHHVSQRNETASLKHKGEVVFSILSSILV